MEEPWNNWVGTIWLIVFGTIIFVGIHSYRRLERRFIAAIARLTGGMRVQGLYRVFDEPNIYEADRRAHKLRKAYLRALHRQSLRTLAVLLGWMFFGGLLLTQLARLFAVSTSG